MFSFLLLAFPSLTSPAALSPPPAWQQQEPDADASAAADAEQEPEKKKKKKFARLKSPDKKKVQGGLRRIEKEKEDEGIAEGVAMLVGVGEAAIPMCLDAAQRMEKADRLPPLFDALDQVLVDEDLELAWSHLKKKAPVSIRTYLTTRYADSELKDAEKFLQQQLKQEDDGLRYAAARGLALRGKPEVLPLLDAEFQQHWSREAKRFRADLAGVPREPFRDSLPPLFDRIQTKEKLSSLHLFELFGTAEDIEQVAPYLGESDTALRLAAINACRVVLDGVEALERPSMTEIIERAESWRNRL